MVMEDIQISYSRPMHTRRAFGFQSGTIPQMDNRDVSSEEKSI